METAFTNTKLWFGEDRTKLVEVLFELSDQGQTERMYRVKALATGEVFTAFEDELL